MLQAMWVHGNSVVPERTIKAEPLGTDGPLTDIPGVPGSGMLGFRRGWGAQFRGKHSHHNWFHFSIPTPVIHEDERANIIRVFVLYRTDVHVSLTDVHVFDGPIRLVDVFRDPTGISGDHDGSNRTIDLRRDINMWDIPPDVPEDGRIHWGVGISVRILFSHEGNVLFTAAGADFDVTRGRR